MMTTRVEQAGSSPAAAVDFSFQFDSAAIFCCSSWKKRPSRSSTMTAWSIIFKCFIQQYNNNNTYRLWWYYECTWIAAEGVINDDRVLLFLKNGYNRPTSSYSNQLRGPKSFYNNNNNRPRWDQLGVRWNPRNPLVIVRASSKFTSL